MDGNLMVAAERCHPFAGKAIAVSGAKIIAVEKASDHIVAANAREQADCFDDFLCCAVALSTPSARQAQFGMNAAHPVHDENDLSLLGIEVGDHFAKELAHDALLRSDVGRRLTPDRLQIERQRHELFGARRCFRRRLAHVFFDTTLQFSDTFECKLQFCGHKPIGRVGRVVLAECFVGGIAGCFEVARERIAHQIAALAFLLIRLQRRFDRSWFEHAKKLVFNGVIDAKAAE
ncbi:MAG: hypothetical protein ACXW3X_07575 [Rhodoplanes sp.]|jgi:hypothetical protein